jgi:hypothetical protein
MLSDVGIEIKPTLLEKLARCAAMAAQTALFGWRGIETNNHGRRL